MEYDAAWKRAQRLTRHNWQAACQSAHALAALGPQVVVGDDSFAVYAADEGTPDAEAVQVSSDGAIWYGPANDRASWKTGSVENVARVLQLILEDQEYRAATLGEVAELLEKAATPSE